MRASPPAFAFALCAMVLACSPVCAAPGAIHLSVSNAPVAACETFTVAVNLSGYTGPAEADGYNFRILYDPARFAVISNSATLHDASSPMQNWLRYPAQENVSGSILSDFTVLDPGVIHVSVTDLRLPPDPLNPRGTMAAVGFLYEVTFTAMTPGVGAISVAPAAGNDFLHDASLNVSTVGAPTLTSASANITVTGVRLQIQRTGPNQVTITWPKGVLEDTGTLGTGWTPVPGATNSFIVPMSGLRRFYRAVTP